MTSNNMQNSVNVFAHQIVPSPYSPFSGYFYFI